MRYNGSIIGGKNETGDGVWTIPEIQHSELLRNGGTPAAGKRAVNYPASYLSLLHFDYPYANDGFGLRDEIDVKAATRDTITTNNVRWLKRPNTKWVGVDLPADVVNVSGPKFGWRCMSCEDTVQGIYNSDVITRVASDSKLSFQFFFMPRKDTAAAGGLRTAGNFVRLNNGSTIVFAAGLNAEGKFKIEGIFGASEQTTATALELNVHKWICVEIGNGQVVIHVNGTAVHTHPIAATTSAPVTQTSIGGAIGFYDELLISTNPVITAPAAPIRGTCKLTNFLGYGNGALGVLNVAANTTVKINVCGPVLNIEGTKITHGTLRQNPGVDLPFTAGDHVMVHVSYKKNTQEEHLGKWEMAQVANTTGGLTLTAPLKVITAAMLNDYRIQVVKIPCYTTATVSGTIEPVAWDGACGGIVGLKTQGNLGLTATGRIISVCPSGNKGTRRNDAWALTHGDLVNRFMLTANVFIMCGGTLSAATGARIGQDSDGSLAIKVAHYVYCGRGYVGFGGRPLYIPANEKVVPEDLLYIGTPPGFQGLRGRHDPAATTYTTAEDGYAPLNIILVANNLALPKACVSCGGGGGGGGYNNSAPAAGGGGGGYGGAGANATVGSTYGGGGGGHYGAGGVAASGGTYNGDPGTALGGGNGGNDVDGGRNNGCGYGGESGSTYSVSTNVTGGFGAGTGFCTIISPDGGSLDSTAPNNIEPIRYAQFFLTTD